MSKTGKLGATDSSSPGGGVKMRQVVTENGSDESEEFDEEVLEEIKVPDLKTLLDFWGRKFWR